MDNGTERELVRRMLGGDEGAFDEFFADYFPRLFRFAVLRLRDPDAAEDLVQNSLIAAVRHLGSWRGEATLFTRSDEVETAWAVVDPIIDYWANKRPDHFPNYAAGTWGPSVADEFIAREGAAWRQP